MSESLAVKYRPSRWIDVIEQDAVKKILQNQLETGDLRNAYLFCGGAGTGKTTCARIFANELNGHTGNPIEIDAASNNGVDSVREIMEQAKTRSMTGRYKVFIIDECHMISVAGWNAMLKILEEPPKNTIFIFCTTDPQKIPKTILSRVQRYEFKRISHNGIVKRLDCIMLEEYGDKDNAKDIDAIEYIAKIADGGMRDAIMLLDKCLAYNEDITLANVLEALGIEDYSTMIELTRAIFGKDVASIIHIVEDIHGNGKDLKQFIRNYMGFVLDLNKYKCLNSFEFVSIPSLYEREVVSLMSGDLSWLLSMTINLNSDIKWDSSPKILIESTFISEVLK